MLAKKQYIDSYIVTFPIKEGSYAETYRVYGAQNEAYRREDERKVRKDVYSQ